MHWTRSHGCRLRCTLPYIPIDDNILTPSHKIDHRTTISCLIRWSIYGYKAFKFQSLESITTSQDSRRLWEEDPTGTFVSVWLVSPSVSLCREIQEPAEDRQCVAVSSWPRSCSREGGLSEVRPRVCGDQMRWLVLVSITSTYCQCSSATVYRGCNVTNSVVGPMSARLWADIYQILL